MKMFCTRCGRERTKWSAATPIEVSCVCGNATWSSVLPMQLEGNGTMGQVGYTYTGPDGVNVEGNFRLGGGA